MTPSGPRLGYGMATGPAVRSELPGGALAAALLAPGCAAFCASWLSISVAAAGQRRVTGRR